MNSFSIAGGLSPTRPFRWTSEMHWPGIQRGSVILNEMLLYNDRCPEGHYRYKYDYYIYRDYYFYCR